LTFPEARSFQESEHRCDSSSRLEAKREQPLARKLDLRNPEMRIALVIVAALAALALLAAASEAVRWSRKRRLTRQQLYRPGPEIE
jgi:hypothetical protein